MLLLFTLPSYQLLGYVDIKFDIYIQGDDFECLCSLDSLDNSLSSKSHNYKVILFIKDNILRG